jgi:hypothetical protein
MNTLTTIVPPPYYEVNDTIMEKRMQKRILINSAKTADFLWKVCGTTKGTKHPKTTKIS